MKTRHRTVTYDHQDAASVAAVAMAQMGRSNRCICEATGLSEGQVNYRIRLASQLEGLERGRGYRRLWRDGEGQAATAASRMIMSGLKARVVRTLPQKLEHQPGHKD